MALSYNLKYKKLTFFHKTVLEKEGEVVIERLGLRLKGKGAGDMGELVYFSDMKDISIADEMLCFASYRKERFELSNFSNLFSSFVRDFFRVRNEWLAETFQMKIGMLFHEYEGQVDLVNRFGNHIQRGKSRLQLYEGSILIIPEQHDCFPVYYNFLKNHEFDEDEYTLKLYLDSGSVIQISKLGTSFGDMQETLESLLGKMYERLVRYLQEVLPDVDPGSLIKLSALLRDGKCVPLHSLKKIDADLPEKMEQLVFSKSSSNLQEKIRFLRSLDKASELYVSLSFSLKPDRELNIKSWFFISLPDKNTGVLAETSRPDHETFYFFRIVTETGDINEKLKEKILELNQSLYITRFDFGPLYRDKFHLRKSKYKFHLRRIPFLQLLRRSFLGKIFGSDMATFQKECDRIFARAGKVPMTKF